MACSASHRSSCARLLRPGASAPTESRTGSTAWRSADWWRGRGSARPGSSAADGQKRVAEALRVTLERLPATPAPAMRLVPLPAGVLTSPDQVDPFYEALSQQRVEVAPVHFDGVGYLRIAAAPYNTPDDYDRVTWPTSGLRVALLPACRTRSANWAELITAAPPGSLLK